MNEFRGKYYTKHIMINRLINIDDIVLSVNNVSVKIIPKINEVINVDDNDEMKSKCDISLYIHGYIECVRNDSSIMIKETRLIEEEFIEVPIYINNNKIKGEVKDIYTYINKDGEIYLSIYYILIFR